MTLMPERCSWQFVREGERESSISLRSDVSMRYKEEMSKENDRMTVLGGKDGISLHMLGINEASTWPCWEFHAKTVPGR